MNSLLTIDKLKNSSLNNNELESLFILSLIYKKDNIIESINNINCFLKEMKNSESPFQLIQRLLIENMLLLKLREYNLRQTNLLFPALKNIISYDYNLKLITIKELTNISGFSFSRSRFF